MAEMEWARPLDRSRPVAAALLRRFSARFLDWEVLLTLGLAAAATSAALVSAQDARMIEVVGEGAKYWPRWRGPWRGVVSPSQGRA